MQNHTSKIVIVVIVSTYWLAMSTNAATFINPNAINPDYPGKCFDPILKKAFKPGQTYQYKHQCVKMTCNKDLSLDGISCGAEETRADCIPIPTDDTAPYPDCCPKFRCQGIEGRVFII